jgi:hypothetical protein
VGVALSLGPDVRSAWEAERRQLLQTGRWAMPTASDDDGPTLVRKQVWVHGWGEGQVQVSRPRRVSWMCVVWVAYPLAIQIDLLTIQMTF